MPYKKQKKFPSKLEEKAIELYHKLPRNISDTEICEKTGLSNTWITQFVRRKTHFVDTGRVEALLAFVSGKDIADIINL